ncbi:MBL fold metallo-hydrolase [Halomarina rubra]|uniref:MBL fold metallo-hydrolase n=1 Tax=Halomarina rubra TaxID=2071873 RepID=A0ABD6ASK6_9EURY|nr:MBL fold metallo-hydrolase [Halomarina rubra]
MTDGRVHRIEAPVDWPPGHVAAYLVELGTPHHRELALVDAAMPDPDSEVALRETLADRDATLADVDHLLLTHPHVDHVGQVTTVLEAADPDVYAPAGVRDRFARDPDDLAATVRTTATAAGLDEEGVERAVEMAVGSLRRNRELLPVESVGTWFADGDTFDLAGTTVEVVHTPGHQADHCCLFAPESGTLLAGDMVIDPFRPVVLHAGLDREVGDAIGAFYDALDRLADLDVDRVYPGHGPVHESFADTVARDRASLDRMLDRTVEAVADGAETAAAVAERRARTRGTEYIVAEVVAALWHLEATGRLDVHRDGDIRRFSTV